MQINKKSVKFRQLEKIPIRSEVATSHHDSPAERYCGMKGERRLWQMKDATKLSYKT